MFKGSVIKNFNNAVTSYNESAIVQKIAAANLKALLKLYIEYIPLNILEIGCGTGLFTKAIIEMYSGTHFVICDIADEMVKKCQSIIEQKSAVFVVADGEKIENKYFHLIVSNLVFQWFNDLHSFLNKVVANNNELFFSIFTDGSFYEWQLLCDRFDIESGIIKFPTINELQADGCVVIKTQQMTLEYPSLLQFLTSLKNIGAVAPKRYYNRQNLFKIVKNYKGKLDITYNIAYVYHKK